LEPTWDLTERATCHRNRNNIANAQASHVSRKSPNQLPSFLHCHVRDIVEHDIDNQRPLEAAAARLQHICRNVHRGRACCASSAPYVDYPKDTLLAALREFGEGFRQKKRILHLMKM